jgi:hypothetical protein
MLPLRQSVLGLPFVESGAKDQAHATGMCKVSNRECVSCHMRKYAIPSMHTEWTDHKIGIQGDSSPND